MKVQEPKSSHKLQSIVLLSEEPPDPRRETLHLVPDQLGEQPHANVQDHGHAGQVQDHPHGELGEGGAVI